MSLVAYAASSDEESLEESTVEGPVAGQISDEEDFPPENEDIGSDRKVMILPLPKSLEESGSFQTLFQKLPVPKGNSNTKIDMIEEEDDEFLHKTATPAETPQSKIFRSSKSSVRISIPSLKDFNDLEEKKEKRPETNLKTSFSSLMNILPQPKSEQSFAKANTSKNKEKSSISFVPDTVQNRRPAHNTENVDRKLYRKLKPKLKHSLVSVSDSEGSDNEGGDFFSLKNDNDLPEVNATEIAAMISKKAKEMAEASSRFHTDSEVKQLEQNTEDAHDVLIGPNPLKQLDKNAVQALIGSQAKRRKMSDLEIIEISSDQVLPNKDEWLRTALASATTYQPTGVLTDEEPAAGTRRKHQITYLAHKAKANEAELQAMWSTNRQNRRQTQSKYGF